MADSNGKVFNPKRAAQNRERALEARNKEMEVAGLETGNKVPQAPDIEEAVLGALMLDPEAVVDVVSTLVPECFYKQENRKIYNAIVQLSQANKAIDIYTVAEQLKANGDLDEVGGTVYLTQLSLKIGAAAHIDYHTKILVDKYIQRKMIGISLDALKKSYDDSEPVDKLLDSTQQEIFELAERNMTRDTKPVKSIISETITKMEKAQLNPNGQSGLHSGYMRIGQGYFWLAEFRFGNYCGTSRNG
jgi:replicative DNA helicase